jgi:hypothetical protein
LLVPGKFKIKAGPPAPHFVELQPAAPEIAKCAILVIGAHFTDFDQEPHDGFLRNSSIPNSGPDGTALD